MPKLLHSCPVFAHQPCEKPRLGAWFSRWLATAPTTNNNKLLHSYDSTLITRCMVLQMVGNAHGALPVLSATIQCHFLQVHQLARPRWIRHRARDKRTWWQRIHHPSRRQRSRAVTASGFRKILHSPMLTPLAFLLRRPLHRLLLGSIVTQVAICT